ncbi:MAG: hypothetical protein ACM3ML_32170 [Micromonosporaceae bacterium]
MSTDPRAAAFTVAVRAALGRHRVFAVALAAGMVLRAATEVGYRWALWFNDSFDYVAVALRLHPDPVRPIGYPLFLRLLQPAHSLAAVTSVQHLLGLGCGVIIYALLRERFRFRGRSATLAAAPMLFDAYQIQLEHLLLADTLFTFMALAAIAAVCWFPVEKGPPLAWRAALAGSLLAFATLTRPVGIPLIAITLSYLVARRVGWRAITAVGLTACAPVAGYVLWFHAAHGQFGLDSTDGIYLWGRTAAFAECGVIKPPASEAWLCPRVPPSQRSASSSQVWQATSPFHWRHGQVFSATENELALRFAARAIAAQPGDYTRTVFSSIGRSFRWDRTAYPTGYTARLYTFAGAWTSLPEWPEPDGRSAAQVARAYGGARAATVIAEPYAGVMRWYQRYIYLRGTLLGLILLVPLAGGLAQVVVRARRREGRHGASMEARGAPGGQRGAAWLCWAAAVALLVVPSMTVDFDYRYVLPVVPFACLAAALAGRRAVAAVLRPRPGTTPGRSADATAASIPTTQELTRSEG